MHAPIEASYPRARGRAGVNEEAAVVFHRLESRERGEIGLAWLTRNDIKLTYVCDQKPKRQRPAALQSRSASRGLLWVRIGGRG